MDNFCYWQEEPPINNKDNNLIFSKKICLFRLNEYRLLKEAEKKVDINIFCPYNTEKEAEECMEYKVSNGKIPK